MTTVLARPPLQTLSMSTVQSNSRRHSARLQHKDDGSAAGSDVHENRSNSQAGKPISKLHVGETANNKRRRNYDEDDDGFAFSRVKKKKPAAVDPIQEEPSKRVATPSRQEKTIPLAEEHRPATRPGQAENGIHSDATANRRRNRMSFSTPAAKQQQTVRRSKRLSDDIDHDATSAQTKARHEGIKAPKVRRQDSKLAETYHSSQPGENQPHDRDENPATATPAPSQEQHSATKISLPFADTPVISRNKAMREGKQKGERRRSSLGLRGRRASSLLDSGTSNALPHSEVSIADFYKHIESDLMEPRRMRLLLTWCGTKAMHPKPQGTSFEDASAKSAARVIEEEVLKEIANKSELSDWFGREDNVTSVAPLPEKPNPKNIHNAQKITELEEQIKRLKAEKQGLEKLLRPPTVKSMSDTAEVAKDSNESLLSPSDEALLKSLQDSSGNLSSIQSRIASITGKLEPSIDTFADGVHKIAQYRTAADGVSSQILSICAEKLANREKEGRKKALQAEDDQGPGRDLSSVLRGLGRTDRLLMYEAYDQLEYDHVYTDS